MLNATQERDWFVTQLSDKELRTALSSIKLIVSDVDGCITNGIRTITPIGDVTKGFSVLDGLGIDCAQKAGLTMALISGDRTPVTSIRAKTLGIPADLYVLVPWSEKVKALETIQQSRSITPEETLVFGDDAPDLSLRKLCRIFATPNDALFYVAHHADLISPRSGGRGALRSIIDLVLYAQGTHPFQSTIMPLLD